MKTAIKILSYAAIGIAGFIAAALILSDKTPAQSASAQADSQPCYFNYPGCTSYIDNGSGIVNAPSNPSVPAPAGNNPGQQPCYFNVPGCSSYIDNGSGLISASPPSGSGYGYQPPAPAPYVDSNGYLCYPPNR